VVTLCSQHGLALAMRYGLQWCSHPRVQGLGMGDEHHAYTIRYRSMASFTGTFNNTLNASHMFNIFTFTVYRKLPVKTVGHVYHFRLDCLFQLAFCQLLINEYNVCMYELYKLWNTESY